MKLESGEKVIVNIKCSWLFVGERVIVSNKKLIEEFQCWNAGQAFVWFTIRSGLTDLPSIAAGTVGKSKYDLDWYDDAYWIKTIVCDPWDILKWVVS